MTTTDDDLAMRSILCAVIERATLDLQHESELVRKDAIKFMDDGRLATVCGYLKGVDHVAIADKVNGERTGHVHQPRLLL